jgi:hypothetical protein
MINIGAAMKEARTLIGWEAIAFRISATLFLSFVASLASADIPLPKTSMAAFPNIGTPFFQ